MFNPHIGAIYLQKYKKYSEKVMIWIDFIYQNGIEISLSSSFGDK